MTKSLAVWLGCGWLALAQVPDPVREAVERGLAAEESGKDLAGATKAYMDAVAAADARRATHATALFRLAEVQRRQGRTNEATELYGRLLVEFPDQTEMVAVARRHVPGASNSPPGHSTRTKDQELPEAERLLDDEIRVAEQQLLSEQRKFEVGRAGDDEVLKARRELLGLKRQLAEKRQRRDVLDVLPTGGSSKVETPKAPVAAPDEEEKEIARLKGLFRNSPDLLNQSGSEGTPLEKAVQQGRTRVIAYLLGEGMPSRSEESLRAGLKAASQAARLDVCRMLLDAGADPNRVDAGGGLPLLRAAHSGRLEVCRMLLDAGADPNRADAGGGLPLLWAAYAGHRAVVELLLDRGANVDGSLKGDIGEWNMKDIPHGTRFRKGANALFMAIYGKRMAVLELLLQRGADANSADGSGVTPLAAAVARKWEDGAQRLLDAGVDPDLGYALHAACAHLPSMIRPLLEAGADPNRLSEKSWMVDVLIAGSWQQQEPWLAPLHFLASWGEPTEGLTALLDAGAFVNAGHIQGTTPLDYARSPEVRALLQARGGRSTVLSRPPGVASGRLPRVSTIVCGALAAVVSDPDPDVPRRPGEEQPRPLPLRLGQFLQQIVSIETNTAGLAPDLSRVVVAKLQNPPQRPGFPQQIRLHPATGVPMNVEPEPPTTNTVDVAAILASGDSSKDIEIPVDGFTHIYVPFKPRPKVERPVRKPASVVVPKGAGLVTVLGAVQRPGNVELVPGKPMDLVQVIAASGGLGRTADRKRIALRRGAETKGVDLDTAMSERVPMEPGDIIEVANVGSVPTVVVFDAMEGEFPVPDGQPLMLSTIMRKLPPNSFANRRKVEIQRVGPDGKPMPTIQVNVDDLLMNNNRSADVELKAGDRIRVPRRVIYGLER
jgi:Ankyrin repeats (3 copies)/SLBB domain